MIDIIEGKSKISLRLLDWFVTNYSRTNGIGYFMEINREEEYFNVNISYKAQLKSYKKTNFDPFRRTQIFNFKYDIGDPSKKLKTTLCQLNFFRWAFSNNIIEYVDEHYNDINESMVDNKKRLRTQRTNADTCSTDTQSKSEKQQKIQKKQDNKSNKGSVEDAEKSMIVSFD